MIKRLRFYLNKDLDKYMASQFLNEKAGGIDFGAGIIKTHPKLAKAKNSENKEKTALINSYFNDYYQKNKGTLLKKLKIIKNSWRKKERDFFKITENLFNGFLFQDGMYVCYLSIIDCNPRFLESKTFQVFYKKDLNDAIYTIVHELTHFIFYDFIEKNLKEEIKNLSEDKIWDLSEIFNVIVLELDLYKNIIDDKIIRPYPDHKKYLPAFKKEFRQSKDIKEFILRGGKILKQK